jgi:hypothetical protein
MKTMKHFIKSLVIIMIFKRKIKLFTAKEIYEFYE